MLAAGACPPRNHPTTVHRLLIVQPHSQMEGSGSALTHAHPQLPCCVGALILHGPALRTSRRNEAGLELYSRALVLGVKRFDTCLLDGPMLAPHPEQFANVLEQQGFSHGLNLEILRGRAHVKVGTEEE